MGDPPYTPPLFSSAASDVYERQGQQRMVRTALPWLRKSDAARIINIASTEGLGATPGNTPYVAAKTGVTGLTRGLAADLGKEGITVNCICPGPILTAMTEKVPEADKAVFATRRTALRRYGLPEAVARMTLNLAPPRSRFVTGGVIPVGGALGRGCSPLRGGGGN